MYLLVSKQIDTGLDYAQKAKFNTTVLTNKEEKKSLGVLVMLHR